MELTGKCEKDFNKWYGDIYLNYEELNCVLMRLSELQFSALPPAVRYGVYQDYFNSVDYKVYVSYNEVAHKWYWSIDFKPVRNDCNGYHDLDLPQARTEAIKKANELRNEQLNR